MRSIPQALLNQHTFKSTCRIQIDAQAGGELTVIGPGPMQTNHDATQVVTAGQGANVAPPALLRKLNLEKPRYDTWDPQPDSSHDVKRCAGQR